MLVIHSKVQLEAVENDFSESDNNLTGKQQVMLRRTLTSLNDTPHGHADAINSE
jgi:hypothetical protein